MPAKKQVNKSGWDDVGGYEDVIEELKLAIEFPITHPEFFEYYSVSPPKGILLYGPPGCGKTHLARTAAKVSKANFISVNCPELLSRFVGKTESNIRNIFKEAKKKPSVIFFDEIDSIAPSRESSVAEHSKSMVSQLLVEMDGFEPLNKIVVIGATNFIEGVDKALLRTGRFDKKIYVPLPNESGREEIFRIYLEKMPVAKDVDVSELAELTDKFSGADIKNLCNEVAYALIRARKKEEIEMEYFIVSIEKIEKEKEKSKGWF